jgi:hypothetical protein
MLYPLQIRLFFRKNCEGKKFCRPEKMPICDYWIPHDSPNIPYMAKSYESQSRHRIARNIMKAYSLSMRKVVFTTDCTVI